MIISKYIRYTIKAWCIRKAILIREFGRRAYRRGLDRRRGFGIRLGFSIRFSIRLSIGFAIYYCKYIIYI